MHQGLPRADEDDHSQLARDGTQDAGWAQLSHRIEPCDRARQQPWGCSHSLQEPFQLPMVMAEQPVKECGGLNVPDRDMSLVCAMRKEVRHKQGFHSDCQARLNACLMPASSLGGPHLR